MNTSKIRRKSARQLPLERGEPYFRLVHARIYMYTLIIISEEKIYIKREGREREREKLPTAAAAATGYVITRSGEFNKCRSGPFEIESSENDLCARVSRCNNEGKDYCEPRARAVAVFLPWYYVQREEKRERV